VRLYSRIGRALLDVKQSGNDPFAAIEAIIPWEVCSKSITDQIKDFEEYLLPAPRFAAQRQQQELGLAVEIDCERFLAARLAVLEREPATAERLAAANERQ
jgi:hypothetical protein